MDAETTRIVKQLRAKADQVEYDSEESRTIVTLLRQAADLIMELSPA